MASLDTYNSRGSGLLSCLALAAVMSSSVALAQAQPARPDDTIAKQLSEPYWGPFKTDKCMAPGIVQKSAILYGIKGSWEDACYHMGAEIDGHKYAYPKRCVKTLFAMWGEFDVPDPKGCRTFWSALKQDKCTGVGTRQYSATLANNGIHWNDACMNTPNDINGVHYEQPTRCRQTSLGQIWGEFDVADESCGPISPQ